MTRIIKDPSAKTAPAPPAEAENTVPEEEETDPALLTQTEPILPLSQDIPSNMDAIPLLLADAGFNADNASLKDEIMALLGQWKITQTLSVVPGAEEGKFVLRLTLSMENTTNNGTVKVVHEIPKSFAESATMLTANYPMTVLKDDPLIQFELSGLTEGQPIEIWIDTVEEYSIEEANAKVPGIAGEAGKPPLLFASGTADPAPGSREGGALLDITGLVSGAGAAAPFAIGLVGMVGIILVSVRVIKGSVEGADNPILRSAAGAQRGGNRPLIPPSVTRRKIWKKGEDAQ